MDTFGIITGVRQSNAQAFPRRRITRFIQVNLYLYSDRTGKKTAHLFRNTQFIFMRCTYLDFIRSNRLLKCFMVRAVFSHATLIFARGCVEKYNVHKNVSYNGLLQK